MTALFRRHSNVQCFFCSSLIPAPTNISNFRCKSCGCWNRYNERGEIISDEPAMHLEHLNSTSFSQRGLRSQDRLPTTFGPGPFCHVCKTNQNLIINLLANYLPDSSDPDYQAREEMLPAYRESLYQRYPPVCESCLPQVEEEIRQKDHMARVQALGASLSKGKQRQRRVSGPDPVKEAQMNKALYWWRIRGCLWALSICISLCAHMSAVWNRYPFRRLSFLQPILPLLVVASLLWTAWDPTYSSLRKAKLRGRQVRIQGKSTYNACQTMVWASRLVSSICLSTLWFRPHTEILESPRMQTVVNASVSTIEIICLAISLFVIRLHQPPTVRLINTDNHQQEFVKSRSGTPFPEARPPTPRTAKTPTFTEHDISSLSLSSKPVITPRSAPVFGFSSMQSTSGHPPSQPVKNEPREDEMDWSPTDGRNSSSGRTALNQDNSWLKPQNFFAPQKQTGLEGLFESAKIQDEPMPYQPMDVDGGNHNILTGHLWKWGPLYVLLIGLLLASITYTNSNWPHLIQWAI